MLLKNVYNAKIKHIEDKIPNITNLVTNTLNAKINEVKCQIPSIINLATKTALNSVENKLVKKKTEFDKLTSENFATRLKQVNLASKSGIANFVNKTDFPNQVKNISLN